jgi:hypothetical protein
MAKSPKHPYGRSSNAVATEADVPLRTLQDFIKSGGSPAKYNSAIQVILWQLYAAMHIREANLLRTTSPLQRTNTYLDNSAARFDYNIATYVGLHF